MGDLVFQPFGNPFLTYPLAPAAPVAINVVFVVDASTSMFVSNGIDIPEDVFSDGLIVPLADADGDGFSSTFFDVAFIAIETFIAELQAHATAFDRTLRVRLVSCCLQSPGVSERTWTQASDLSAWVTSTLALGAVGASDLDAGTAAAIAWFTTVGALPTDTNVIIFLSDWQVTHTTALGALTTWRAAFNGRQSARYIFPFGAWNAGADGECESFTTDGVTSLDPNFGLYAYDRPSADACLEIDVVLGLSSLGADLILLEDGSFILQEDGTSFIELEA